MGCKAPEVASQSASLHLQQVKACSLSSVLQQLRSGALRSLTAMIRLHPSNPNVRSWDILKDVRRNRRTSIGLLRNTALLTIRPE